MTSPQIRLSRSLTLIIAVLLLASALGCLRYVPSRSEIVADQDDDTAQAEYAGEDAFFSIDRMQEQRLRDLIRSRAANRSTRGVASYQIGVGDVLQLSVFDVEEMNRKIRVRPDGKISLPLVGIVQAAGKTEEQLQLDIASRLEEFMFDPQVQVFIEEYTGHKVWVIGEIQKPGAYALTRDNYSLIELLSEAGGRTERAGGSIILIPQGSQKNIETRRARMRVPVGDEFASAPRGVSAETARHGIEIAFDSLVGTVDAIPYDVPLQPGDTIVVPEVGKVQVDGEVSEPGSYELASRMTLLGAIAAAKGLTYSADVEEVEVLRELGSGKKALITVDLEKIAFNDGNDIRLRNGDLVRVPSSAGRFATRQTINILNGVFGRVNPF
ncbi:MAG: polysaccharide biosynthesis/export family protein [Bdellovibrionales bacterium]|nr:polysaccharide biosynthesis/export family protein [Bdellovibrionales bacterium]